MLLGGREEVYRKMYLKTIEAIKKHLLYRPMVPDSLDILFTGAIQTSTHNTELTLMAEVEHLTCFIGGMVGMSAKVFDLEGDLELAKKLTDGCVWAYGVTPSGIMPEGSTVIACENAEHCAWNETAYYEYLDPTAAERDRILAEYVASKEKLAAEEQAQEIISKDDGRGGKQLPKRDTFTPTSSYDEKVLSTEAELNNKPSGHRAEVPLSVPSTKTVRETVVDPLRPQSHKEYVESRIKQGSLPPGMVALRARGYILRYIAT